jgi:hypothetical protein
VNDPVVCQVTRRARAYCNSIGPHAPGAEEVAFWENVWYNPTVVYIKLKEVSITWMDSKKRKLKKSEYRVVEY